MSRKKSFRISPALSQGLEDTISIVENNESLYRSSIIPIGRLEPDPENPRTLKITGKDIQEGISISDPSAKEKKIELEKIRELSVSIKKSGLINPIVAYKYMDKYRIVAGERRFLASLLIGKPDIEARIFQKKPSALELKLVQWYENTAREDLSLQDRLDNLRAIFEAKGHTKKLTARYLEEITGISKSQVSNYIMVLNAAEDVTQAIKAGHLTSLKKAVVIASVQDPKLRKELLSENKREASLSALKKLAEHGIGADGKDTPDKPNSQKKKKIAKVNLGATKEARVVRTVINAVLEKPEFKEYNKLFSAIVWEDLNSVSDAFRKLLKIIESQVDSEVEA